MTSCSSPCCPKRNQSFAFKDENGSAVPTTDTKGRLALMHVVRSVSNAYCFVRYSGFVHRDGMACSKVAITKTLGAIDVHAPGADMERIILHFHGGAFVGGSVWTTRDMVGRLSAAAGARIISVAYRLSPEHPFPAALDDAMTAWSWIRREHPTASVAVAGNSAGGNLSFALMVKLAQLGEELPVACVGMSPWLNIAREGMAASDEGTCVSVGLGISLDAWKKASVRCKERYCKEHRASDPLVSPAFASEDVVRKFPPVCIHAAEGEPPHLVEDAKDMVALCQRCGVTAELQLYPETQHVFQAFGKCESSKDSLAKLGAFLAQAWPQK